MEFIIFLFGCLLGKYISDMLWKRAIVKMLLSQVDIKELPELTAEVVDSSIRLYEKGVYLCQGQSIDDVASNFFSARHIKLAQVKYNDKDIWFVDGKVQTNLD